MKNPAVVALKGADTTRTGSVNGYCEHASARQVRLYMPYAEANTIRLRTAQAPRSQEAHASWLYEIPGGWGWTICRECRTRERQSA